MFHYPLTLCYFSIPIVPPCFPALISLLLHSDLSIKHTKSFHWSWVMRQTFDLALMTSIPVHVQQYVQVCVCVCAFVRMCVCSWRLTAT